MRLVVSPEMNGFAAIPAGVRPDVLFPGMSWQATQRSGGLRGWSRAAFAKLKNRQPAAPPPAPRRFLDCVDLLEQAIPARPSVFEVAPDSPETLGAPRGRSFADTIGTLNAAIPPKLTFGDLNLPAPAVDGKRKTPLAESA